MGAVVPLAGPGLLYLCAASLVIALFLRSSDTGALIVGGYWVTFAVKSTVFSQVIIEGLFYPFYIGFALVVLGLLLGRGLRVSPPIFWLLFAFFGAVFVSLVGYTARVDSGFIQEFVAMLVCPLVLLAIQSRSGLRLVGSLAALAGVGIAAWIIVESALGGFTYRGDVSVNQNIAAFVVGISLTVLIGSFLHRVENGRPVLVRSLQLIGIGVMAYSLLLLASRGMTIALIIAAVAMFARAASRDPRVLRTIVVLLIIMASGLLLPGGDGLLERFEGESVDSAGDRTPIWKATIDALVEGDFLTLSIGNGFNSSQEVVQQATATHTSTHNAYLSVVYEYGLLGLLLFLALHVIVLTRAAAIGEVSGIWGVGIIWFLLGANLTATTPDDFMYWLALGFSLACVSVSGKQLSFDISSRIRPLRRSEVATGD